MIWRVCIFFIGASALIGCKQTVGELNLPVGFDGNYALAFTDTCSVRCSTVLMDSLPTSGQGQFLVGYYEDPELGLVEAAPYFQIELNPTKITSDYTYDSAVLLMKRTGYAYGDVSDKQLVTLQVQRVNEDMRLYKLPSVWREINEYNFLNLVGYTDGFGAYHESGGIYNKHEFGFDSQVIGEGTTLFDPITKTTDTVTVRVKMHDDFGQELFAYMKLAPVWNDGDGFHDIDKKFKRELKGLRVHASDARCVFGVYTGARVSSSSSSWPVRVRVYYHSLVGGEFNKVFQDFTYSYIGSYGHTNIVADFSGTDLDGLTIQNNQIAASQTGETTFIQSGVGLATKMDLPNIGGLVNLPGYVQLNRVQLVLEPVAGTQANGIPFPSTVRMYYAGKRNMPSSPVPTQYPSSSYNYQEAALNVNNLTQNFEYRFDLTKLAQALIAVPTNDSKKLPLVITTGQSLNSGVFSTASRVVLGSSKSKYKTRLEVTYLRNTETTE